MLTLRKSTSGTIRRQSPGKHQHRYPCISGVLGDQGTSSSLHLANSPVTAYMKKVKEALRQRPDSYKEFLILYSQLKNEELDTMALIERMITLLDGHQRLIERMYVILPEGFVIEVQEDAVIVKVVESLTSQSLNAGRVTPRTHSGYSDSSKSAHRKMNRLSISAARGPLGYSTHKLYTSQAKRHSACVPYQPTRQITKRRWSTSPQRMQRSATWLPRPSSASPPRRTVHFYRSATGAPLYRHTWTNDRRTVSFAPVSHHRRLTGRASSAGNSSISSVSSGSMRGDTTSAYIGEVRKRLGNNSESYKRFIHLVDRYRAGQIGDVEAARAIISQLSSNPNLVLGFNELLPSGYRIRMYDSSCYTLEYPAAHGLTDHEKIPISG